MMELHVKRTVKRVKMIERSLFSARRCFVENLFRSGKMPSSEYSVLLEWYRYVTRPPGACHFGRAKKKIVPM